MVPALLAVALVAASPDPRLWELGVGVAGVSVPDYGGADQRQHRVVPFPYFVYRGKRVQADRDGVHFVGTSRLELDFSFDAGPPVSSTDNDAREGMPDLLPSVEVGPSVNVVLLSDDDRSHALKVRLAGRASVATDVLHWEWLGFTAAPELALQIKRDDWKLTASVGPLLSTEGVHDYVYEVEGEYDARGGYGGMRALVRGGWRTGPIWLGGFARYDYFGGAVFADSPVVRSRHAFTVGTAIAWIFARSKRAAKR